MKKIITIPIMVLLFLFCMVIPVSASTLTKEELLNNIVSIQQNSTENQLSPILETLIQEKITTINSQLVANVMDYGAKGNGIDSDVTAVKSAITYLNTKGGGSLFFPAKDQNNVPYNFVFDSGVMISKNINLVGEQTNLSRATSFNVATYPADIVFTFYGNNTITGIVWDGGLTRIPDTGLYTDEFCYYYDFGVPSTPEGLIFYNNVFLNAKGAFIEGGINNSIIYKNIFGEYGDHCIYGGGRRTTDGTKIDSQNIIISDNTFTALTSMRDAVKFRNGGEKIIVANNIFDIPTGSLYTFALCDNVVPQADILDISFSYNYVKNCKDVGFIGLGNIPLGSTLGKLDNVRISNNVIDNCSGYIGIGGSVWQSTSNYDYFSESNIEINNNTFNKNGTGRIPWIHLCCKGDGVTVNIIGNKFYGGSTNYNFITMYGNVNLNLLNNEIKFAYNNSILINSPYIYVGSSTLGIQATSPRTINISGNNISGIYKIFQENKAKDGLYATYLNDKINFILKNNTFTRTGTTILYFGIDPALTNLIKANLYMSNNLVTQNNIVSSISNLYYPKQYITIANTPTKEDILNNIELVQQNSTENQINSDIEAAIQQELTNANNHLVINIMDYGAKGNGIDSDVIAIKNAVAYLNTKGGGSIFFPATAQHYVVDNIVTISPNINLIGEQTKIFRYHNYLVNHNTFIFLGNNLITGFIFDGGLTRIPDTGLVTGEFCYYDEFNSRDCIFYNNTFLNAKGTFIGGRGHTIIYNNAFGEYGDHCIYMGGSTLSDGTTDYTQRVVISNNNFTALTSTREAIKYRNSGELITIANNIFDIPNGALFCFALCDNINLQGNMKDISFSYNNVKVCKSMGVIDLGNTPLGSTLGTLDKIKISNNIIDSAGYLLIGEATWNEKLNLSYFNGSNIEINNNIFNRNNDPLNKVPQIHLCCKGNGLKVDITNNKFYGRPNNNSFIMMYGNTSLNLVNNTLNFVDGINLIDSPYHYSNYTLETIGIQATTLQIINISGNNITGVRKIYQELSTNVTTYLTDKINFNLIDNTLVKNGLPIIFGTDAIFTNLIQTKLTMLNNLVTQDGNVGSISTLYYPEQYITSSTIVTVTDITLNQSTMNLTIGKEEGYLIATIYPDNATNKDVIWSSNDVSIATISSNGIVTPISEGIAIITATTTNGLKSTCTVAVLPNIIPVIDITLNQSTMNLTIGTTGLLIATISPDNATNKSVIWSSSNKYVATVDTNGVVTPITAGPVNITVTTIDGAKTATCLVIVSFEIIPVTNITLNQSTMSLIINKTKGYLIATVYPTNATNKDVIWNSSNNSIATVNSNGIVTPISKGTAIITATTIDGLQKATCTVVVYPKGKLR